MMDKTLITRYQKSKEKLSALRKQTEQNTTERQDELSKTESHYRKKIWELEGEKREAVAVIQKKYDSTIEQLKERMKPEAEDVKAVEQLFKLLSYEQDAEGGNLQFNLKFSGYRGDYYIEQLEEIIDAHYVVKVAIVQNDKPKNRFSLMVCGKHLFPERLVQVTRNYGFSVHCDNGFLQIEFSAKDAPNVETLKAYFEKNIDRVLNPTLSELSIIKTQLEQAKNHLKSADFEIEYIKWKLEYLETQYSRGTETDEYKSLLKKLAVLQGGVR